MERETINEIKNSDELNVKERLKLDRQTILKMIISSIVFLSGFVLLFLLL